MRGGSNKRFPGVGGGGVFWPGQVEQVPLSEEKEGVPTSKYGRLTVAGDVGRVGNL
jgi:hypothetical protein